MAIRQHCKILSNKLFICLVIMHSTVALAGIPRLPSDVKKGDTDFLTMVWTIFKKGLGFAAIGIVAIAFLALFSTAWREFSEARRTNEWGNFGKICGIGIGLLMLTIVGANMMKDTLV